MTSLLRRSIGPALLIALASLVFSSLFLLPQAAAVRPPGLFIDFNAFYCAGRVAASGADPYLAEPLRACERTPHALPFVSMRPGIAMPVPYPPYVIAFFSLFARLPYELAARLWLFVLTASSLTAILALSSLSGLALVTVAASLALTGAAYDALLYGQVGPISLAATAVSAWLLSRRHVNAAAVAATATMIEPHVGLPLCLALFAFVPRARLALAAGAAALIAISLVSSAGGGLTRYFFEVLPLHARSELQNQGQLSLTYVLHQLGVPAALALTSGSVWYALMLLAGLYAAGRLRNTACEDALPLVPPAFAMFGGTFLHVAQVVMAMPAALVLFARFPARRAALGVAIVLLAVPWAEYSELGPVAALAVGAVTFILAGKLFPVRPFTAGAVAIAAMFAFMLPVFFQQGAIVPSDAAFARANVAGTELAERSWIALNDAEGDRNGEAYDVVKPLSWLALLLVMEASLRAGARRPTFLRERETRAYSAGNP